MIDDRQRQLAEYNATVDRIKKTLEQTDASFKELEESSCGDLQSHRAKVASLKVSFFIPGSPEYFLTAE
jgi:hypothetical protein